MELTDATTLLILQPLLKSLLAHLGASWAQLYHLRGGQPLPICAVGLSQEASAPPEQLPESLSALLSSVAVMAAHTPLGEGLWALPLPELNFVVVVHSPDVARLEDPVLHTLLWTMSAPLSAAWQPAPLERSRHILENLQDAFFALDQGWRFIYVNRLAEAMLGRLREDLLGQSIWTLYPMMEGSRFAREYQHAMEHREPRHFEAYATALRAWFEISAYPTANYLGIYFHDVTERKRQQMRERALVSCEASVRQEDTTLGAMAALGRALCALSGWQRAEVWMTSSSTAPPGYLCTTTSYEPLEGGVRHVGEGPHAFVQLEPSHPAYAQGLRHALYMQVGDGEQVMGTLGLMSSDVMDREGWAALVTSVREELASLIQRRRTQIEFNRLFDLSPDLICIADMHGRFLRVNPAFSRLLGYPIHALLERPYLELVHPLDLPRTLRELERLNQGLTTLQFENRYLCADGSVRWLSWTSHPMPDEGTVYATARDVTEHKRQIHLESLQRRALEKIASGSAPKRVMAHLCRLIEEHDASMLASFQVLDASKSCLLDGASGSLPPDFAQRLYPLPIGPDMTTGGSAAYHRSTTLTTDITTDERWVEHRALARQHDLRACWCAPLLSAQGQLLGAISVYRRAAGAPDAHQLSLMENAARLATIALERAQSQSLIELLLRALDVCSDMVAISELRDGVDSVIYANCAMTELVRREEPSQLIGRPLPLLEVMRQANPIESQQLTQELLESPMLHTTIAVPSGRGEARWVELSLATLRDGPAPSEHFITIARDVSDRMSVEELLREREERFRLLASATSDALYDLNLRDGAIWWSSGIQRIFGYPSYHAIHTMQGWVEAIDPEDREATQRSLQAAIKAGDRQWSCEYRMRRYDGSVAWVTDRGSIVYAEDGQPLRVVGGMTDQTPRRKVEQRLHEQAALLDKTLDAIRVEDLQGRVQFWNQAAARLYDITPAQAVGQQGSDLTRVDETSHRATAKLVMERGYWNGEVNLKRDAKTLTLDERWTLMRDAAGEPRAFLIAQTDITERKQLETQYLRAQRMESIGTLAGGIAHDLNNILTPILVSVGLLRDQLQSQELAEMVDDIELAANRGADLVKQILSFARGAEATHAPVEPSSLFKDISRIVRESFPRNIQLQIQASAHLPWLLGDATQLHQVLLNLAINARDAMPEGGRLTMSAEALMLDEHYAAMHPNARPGPHVVITISDTGEGISPEVQERIFEPFFTTKPLGQGTGLGLSTVQAIVKSHGGFMTLYSELTKGTTFKVYLPTAQHQESSPAQQAQRLLRGRGELILVVDDESSILSVTQQTLEAFGYRVVTAGDGAEAIAIYAERRHEIALVLTDIMMPIMDGLSTARAMTRLNPQVRIIAASGLNANATLTKLTDAGVRHFLPKPYTAEGLLSKLRDALGAAPDEDRA